MLRAHSFFLPRFTEEDVLDQMQGSGYPSKADAEADAEADALRSATADALRSTYKGFKTAYWRCVNRVTGKLLRLKKEAYKSQFVEVLRKEQRDLVAFAHTLAKPRLRSTATAQMLVATIFAWWTVDDCKPALDTMRLAAESKASRSGGGGDAPSTPGDGPSTPGGDDVDDDTSDKKYLRQPHAAQVLSVFRLLGIRSACSEDYVKKQVDSDEIPVAEMFDMTGVDHEQTVELENHMAEIKTGEGARACVPCEQHSAFLPP